MTHAVEEIKAVPTNIITGFLGVGKTSAILHLLKNKPERERWAVLVNEFGEIGVDGSLFEGERSEDDGVFVREVPGGCMCCAAGLPMQIALNQLLVRAKPDRLLIEPTGLGHPEEVLQILSAEHYQRVLDLQKILTLVDARKLSDPRYTEHKTFNQQVAIADVIVGNKMDLYEAGDEQRLVEYAKQHNTSNVEVVLSQNGAIDADLLIGKTQSVVATHHHHHSATARPLISEEPIPECGYLKAVNEGEGFRSIGWRFASDRTFDYAKLFAFLNGVSAERMKAVFITDKGVFAYNLTPDALTEKELDECIESRCEIISERLDADWEKQLMACVQLAASVV